MRKTIAVLLGLVSLVYLAGCGNNPTATVTTYDFPTKIADKPATSKLLGGAMQGGGAVAFNNYSVTTFAGSSFGFNNISTAGAATFNRPIAVTTDGTNLYVADYYNNAIRRINIKTQRVTTIGNSNGAAGSADGAGTAAFFNRPSGITTDGTYLYVADSGNYTIRKIDPTNGGVITIAGAAGTAASVDADLGTNARFNVLNGITTDGFSLYVTDSNNTIRRVDLTTSNAKVTTLAGVPGKTGAIDGPPQVAQFNQPARLTTDGPYLYVTDFGDSTIRKIVLATGVVSTFAGISAPGGPPPDTSLAAAAEMDRDSTGGTSGTGLTARFNQPSGITTDGVYLYVTDAFAGTVRRIEIGTNLVFSGPVTTIAGNAGAPVGLVDGNQAEGRFNTPVDITSDGVNLYVVDIENHRIRKIH